MDHSWEDVYVNQIRSSARSIESAVGFFAPRLADATVYLAGIGKSGLIARKCVATWQSMGLSCHYMSVPDMLHGDIGVLRPGDGILYCSNSGNTSELIAVTEYIRSNKPYVSQFLVSNNPVPTVTAVDQHFMIGTSTFVEADSANRAPSVSSVIFMMFLDQLGIRIAETNGITAEGFRQNHPSGELGRK